MTSWCQWSLSLYGHWINVFMRKNRLPLIQQRMFLTSHSAHANPRNTALLFCCVFIFATDCSAPTITAFAWQWYRLYAWSATAAAALCAANLIRALCSIRAACHSQSSSQSCGTAMPIAITLTSFTSSALAQIMRHRRRAT